MKEKAAITIQRFFRGHSSRKQTNIYGSSQGKEIELYLPLAVKKIGDNQFSYYNMVGWGKYVLYHSDLFSIQIDFMTFTKGRVKIPEIVTAPFKSPHETASNLFTEKEIDDAISDLVSIVEEFTRASAGQNRVAFLPLHDLIQRYNELHIKHPLSMKPSLRAYLNNPVIKSLFSDKFVPVEQHQNVEICLVYEPGCLPQFDASDTPRTQEAQQIIQSKSYKNGQLLVHIQKTYSLPVEHYAPEFLDRTKNPFLHHTDQQIDCLNKARLRAELFIEKHPLPPSANRMRILGLLTICAEHVLTVVNAKEYVNLHEKTDYAVFAIRQTLHYVKKNICSKEENQWFYERFCHNRQDIRDILCDNKYVPDYRGNSGGTRLDNPFNQSTRYDVIFDLFGEFANNDQFSKDDYNNPLSHKEIEQLQGYGITSWKSNFENHMTLFGKTHLRLQKVGKEFQPLFEARRIGLMTTEEFRNGKSQVYPNASQATVVNW